MSSAKAETIIKALIWLISLLSELMKMENLTWMVRKRGFISSKLTPV